MCIIFVSVFVFIFIILLLSLLFFNHSIIISNRELDRRILPLKFIIISFFLILTYIIIYFYCNY